MRLYTIGTCNSLLLLLVVAVSTRCVSTFTPQAQPERSFASRPIISSAVEVTEQQQTPGQQENEILAESVVNSLETQAREFLPLTESEINARLSRQMAKLQERDRTSQMTKEDLKIVYEDDDLVVVDKPRGVLSVPGKIVNPSLAQIVFETVGCEMGRMDQMVVHRLGFDTSGLMVFCKSLPALQGMNELFRTRAIERKYEALVCGHIGQDMECGMLDLPLMRDPEFPPFMRVSTEAQQWALVNLNPEQLTNPKLLEAPKESITKYHVVAREELFGLPVTRVALVSLSGRTHQLNVHLAAFGHPIVGDAIYGIDGDAAANGGLTEQERDNLVPNPSRATEELQRRIARSANGKIACIHAKSLKFRHPTSGEEMAFVADSPF